MFFVNTTLELFVRFYLLFRTFSYFIDEAGKINITDIKMPNEELGNYLEKCIPKYIVIDGWNSYISDVTKKEDLPEGCLLYIKMLEIVTGVKAKFCLQK